MLRCCSGPRSPAGTKSAELGGGPSAGERAFPRVFGFNLPRPTRGSAHRLSGAAAVVASEASRRGRTAPPSSSQRWISSGVGLGRPVRAFRSAKSVKNAVMVALHSSADGRGLKAQNLEAMPLTGSCDPQKVRQDWQCYADIATRRSCGRSFKTVLSGPHRRATPGREAQLFRACF
jgi:hypothetical protein